MGSMLEVTPVPALRDNYIWVVHDGAAAAVVDPGEAAPIVAWLKAHGMRLTAILVTHHHGDHTGGVRELVGCYGCPVYGPPDEDIAGITQPVTEAAHIVLQHPAAVFRVLRVPGHTRGHLAYHGEGHLFCGDTLFSCGCGRLCEGTAEQLYASLARLAALPAESRVCCAHEYTLANIAFAREVDPANQELAQWQRQATALRRTGRPTLPVSLERELRTNPFLRCDKPEIRAAVRRLTGSKADHPVQVFAGLRKLKDQW